MASFKVGEICDDGNTEDDDGCLSTCAPARCGDGVQRLDLEAPGRRATKPATTPTLTSGRNAPQAVQLARCSVAFCGVTCSPSRRVTRSAMTAILRQATGARMAAVRSAAVTADRL